MPRRRRIAPFYLAVTDKEKRLFSLEEPMTDDSAWNQAVCEAQKTNPAMRCFNAGNTYDEGVATWQGLYKLTRVPSGTIVSPTKS